MTIASAAPSSVLQAITFAAIPFVFYLSWMGLYTLSQRTMLWSTVSIVMSDAVSVVLCFFPSSRGISLAESTTAL